MASLLVGFRLGVLEAMDHRASREFSIACIDQLRTVWRHPQDSTIAKNRRANVRS